MKTIWVSRYYNGTADVFDEDHGPPSWPYVDAFEAKQRIVELEARAEKAEANYQFMVCRAADEKLDGYRELGQRAADAENERDELKRHIAELEAQLPKVVRPEKETDYPLSYWCDCDGEVFSGDVACRQCGAKLDWRTL